MHTHDTPTPDLQGPQSLANAAEQAVSLAQKFGAQSADVMASRSIDFEVKVADGKITTLSQATSKGLGLRVFIDGRLGFCTTGDFSPMSLSHAVERAVQMAQQTAADPHHGLAERPNGVPVAAVPLDLFDPNVAALSVEDKIAWAHRLEAAARGADPRVQKFRDSGVATCVAEQVFLSSAGSQCALRSTDVSLWCTPVAEEQGQLQTDFWYDAKTHLEDLQAVEHIGHTAGLRAARMLGARPVKTQTVPVIFEPHMTASLLAGMLGALDGGMVYKNVSFLRDKLAQRIAVPGLSLVDDPLVARGLASTHYDGEGLPTARKKLLDQGHLKTFLYDSYTARKAGVAPTANARRSYGSMPHAGVFNLHVEAGPDEPDEILRSAPRALLVTRTMGLGLNTISGEYSSGANGLWIEQGEIVHPVQEVTIAGDFLTMLKNIDRIGRNVQWRGSMAAPTVRIAEMTVSGG